MSKLPVSKKKKQIQMAFMLLLGCVLFFVVLTNARQESYVCQEWDHQEGSICQINKATIKTKGAIERPWPKLELDDLLRHNPFKNLHTLASNHTGQPGQATIGISTEPQVLAIEVYLDSKQGKLALIDGKVVREGDQLADGRIVTKLTSEHALVSYAK